MTQIDELLRKSFTSFISSLRASRWLGREREAVSYFTLGFIAKHVGSSSFFKDLSQFVIEGAVPQMPGTGKEHVNKDLLIWPQTSMTCWDKSWKPTHVPLAILEWKVYRPRTPRFRSFHTHDIDWLKWFTNTHNSRQGYAVALDLGVDPYTLRVARVFEGDVDFSWLHF